MIAYKFRCSCGSEWESDKDRARCPKCGARQTWFGMVQRPNDGTDRVTNSFIHIKMPVESPIEHQKWFNSAETQAKLRSGEYEIPTKGSDIAQHREAPPKR